MSPLFDLKGTIEALLDWVKKDFNTYTEEQDTWLFQFTHYRERVEDVADFYNLVKTIFLRTEIDRNMLTVSLEFPKDTNLLPVIVLREPTRRDGDTNIIGGIDNDIITTPNGSQMRVIRDSKQFNYDIMCVGVNYEESLVISDTLYALLVGAYNTFASRYEKVSYDLRELLVNQEFNPYPIFVRTIGLSLQKSNFIPSIERETSLDQIQFEYKFMTDYGKKINDNKK